MGVSDVVVGNLTTVYLVVIAAVKARELACGQGSTGVFVQLVVSTAAVGVILIGSIIWDLYRKLAAKGGVARGDHGGGSEEICRGGICWHGVAVRSPASQLQLRLPPPQQQHRRHNNIP